MRLTPPSLSLSRYAGSYADSTYGTVEVTLVDGSLRAKFGNEDLGTLVPWEYEIFRSPESVFTFVPDGRGNVASLQIFGTSFVRVRR